MNLRLLLITAICSFLCACSGARAANLEPLPSGWFVADASNVSGVSSDEYTIGVDPAVLHNGHNSANIGSKGSASSQRLGAFMQTFAARDYRGKRIQFAASVKTRDAAFVGLWMRVDGSLGAIRFDNMRNRPIKGTTDWKTYDVVLDVPENAVSVSVGLLDDGNGEAWMSDATFGIAGKSTPTTDIVGPRSLSDGPQNLEFRVR